MRLDFNILWVEDQPNQVEAQRVKIERQMRNEGFKLQTEFVSSVEEAEAHLTESVFRDHVDLVLMDFELAGEKSGDEGLEMVRDWCPFKDIIFYSAKVPGELKKLVEEKGIPGVFCTSRIGLPDTVFGIFSVLVKKVLDIDHSRGIVMGATSEIDEFVAQALDLLFADDGDGLKDQALEIAADQIAKIKAEIDEEFSELEALEDPEELKNYHRIYSSAKRLILLKKLLKSNGHDKADIKAMNEYERNTVPRRNVLAHVTVERNGFARRILDKKGVELTTEDMRELRVNLLAYHELFESLLGKIR